MNKEGAYSQAAVFMGSSGGETISSLTAVMRNWRENGRDWGNIPLSEHDALTRFRLAAHIGALLTQNNWQVMTGGYPLGAMGMANFAAANVADKSDSLPRPLGVIFPSMFPNDTPVRGELVPVNNLAERLGVFMNANAFFVLGGGGSGTINEITTAVKDNDLRRESTNEGVKLFKERPIIMIDPTHEVQNKLKIIYGANLGIPHLYDLGEENFTRNKDFPRLARMNNKATDYILSLLIQYRP